MALRRRISAFAAALLVLGLPAGLVAERIGSSVLDEFRDSSPPNTDRLTCIRQDNLDLVVPPNPKHILRMVIPVSSTDTGRDIYVTADAILIKSLSLRVNLRRVDDTIRFDIFGTDTYKEHADVATAKFWISGLELLTQSYLLDVGATLAANRQQLGLGQDGSLQFKMSGHAHAVWSDDIKRWELKLIDQTSEPFKFEIQAQSVLQWALNDYGGIDKLLMDAVWKGLQGAIPESVVASFQYLDSEALGMVAQVDVSGGSPTTKEKIKLDVTASVSFNAKPTIVLDVFNKHFNVAAMAKKRMDDLVASLDLQKIVNENRESVEATLQTYGIELPEGQFDVESIKDLLYQATEKTVDGFVRSLEPFLTAAEKGITGIFRGVRLAATADTSWNVKERNGDIQTLLVALQDNQGNPRKLVELPQAFLGAVGLDQMLKPAAKGESCYISPQDITFRDGELRMARMSMNKVRVAMGNQTYKLGGALRDMALRLPSSWSPSLKAEFPKSTLRISEAGDLSVELEAGNPQVVLQDPKDPNAKKPVASPSREGIDMAQLNGKLASRIARPLKPKAVMSRTELLPEASLSVTNAITGEEDEMFGTLVLTAKATLDMTSVLRSLLAARAPEDFGYTFLLEEYEHHVKASEGTNVHQVVAVVSCGYLRLLMPSYAKGTTGSPLDRLKIDPSTNQLQLDLALYTSPPILKEGPASGTKCVDLSSSGMPKRLVSKGYFRSEEAEDLLCGPASKVRVLAEAIGMQVTRFTHDPQLTKDWNYGTHDASEDMYMLPPDQETISIAELAR